MSTTQSPISENVKDCYVENNQPDKQYDEYIKEYGICLERNNYKVDYVNNCKNEFNAKMGGITYDTRNFDTCLNKIQNTPVPPSKPDTDNKFTGWAIFGIVLVTIIPISMLVLFGYKNYKKITDAFKKSAEVEKVDIARFDTFRN